MGLGRRDRTMTPFEIANSDGLKTQLMETGEVTYYPFTFDGRIDEYVDAGRALAHDLGLSAADIEIHLLQPSGRLWMKVK